MDTMDTRGQRGIVAPSGDSGHMTANDASAILGVSQRTIRRAIARGDLRAHKANGVYQIARHDLANYAARVAEPVHADVNPADAGIPVPLTTFVGRELEVHQIIGKVETEGVRLLTLTGPGGVGKTRLAIEVARHFHQTTLREVHFLSLVDIDSPDEVIAAIIESVVAHQTPHASLELAVDYLSRRDALLVLDNLEHVIHAAASIAELLAQCPRLQVLTTSRVRLRIVGEHEYPISPLGFTTGDSNRSEPDRIGPDVPAAVQLFVARAREIQPQFRLDESTAPIIRDICARLDGLPLAIELAAARIRVLTPQMLLSQLSWRLALLTGGDIDRPARHRTMEATIAWSYALLTPEERQLFRRSSICVGGLTLDLAARLMDGDQPGSQAGALAPVIDQLQRLAEHSLLQPLRQDGDDSRFGMLETIREYGLNQLALSGEEQEARRSHAAWMMGLIKEHCLVPFEPIDERKMDRLVREHRNIEAALEWLQDNDATAFVTAVAWLSWLWWIRRDQQHELAWLEHAVSLGDERSPDHARNLTMLASAYLVGDDLEQADELYAQALTLYRRSGDPAGCAHTLLGLGVAATYRENYGLARRRFTESLAHAREISSTSVRTALEAAVDRNLGVALRDQGHLEQAERCHLEALELERQANSDYGVMHSLVDLGDVAREMGRLGRAASYYQESLHLGRVYGETRVMLWVLEGVAILLAEERGDLLTAARLIGAAQRWRDVTGLTRRPRKDLAAYQHATDLLRTALGAEQFNDASSAGATLTLAEALAEAELQTHMMTSSRDQDAMKSGACADTDVPSLTSRECAVLHLVSHGMSNREIAEHLFISVRTVENHVARICKKLRVQSRSAAVNTAIASGFIHAETGLPTSRPSARLA